MWSRTIIMAIKYLITKLIRECLWILSEIEALIAEPNDFLFFRRIYLCWQKVKYGKSLWVGRGFRLLNRGNLVLGERCALGDYVRIVNYNSIIIGDDFIGSAGLHLETGSHDPTTLEPNPLPIHIGNRVWCGINITILAGVTIGDDVVLGAGSLVCRDIPSNSVAVGVPARVIKPLLRDNSTSVWTWALRKKN
jgi:maltose O-acetyltransferase